VTVCCNSKSIASISCLHKILYQIKKFLSGFIAYDLRTSGKAMGSSQEQHLWWKIFTACIAINRFTTLRPGHFLRSNPIRSKRRAQTVAYHLEPAITSFPLCINKAVCTRHASYAVFERMRLISWRHVLFWCVWYRLLSSRTCFYIDASDSLLWLNFTRTQTIWSMESALRVLFYQASTLTYFSITDIRIFSKELQIRANPSKFKLRELLCVPMQRVLKYHLLVKVCRIVTVVPSFRRSKDSWKLGLYDLKMWPKHVFLRTAVIPR